MASYKSDKIFCNQSEESEQQAKVFASLGHPAAGSITVIFILSDYIVLIYVTSNSVS